MNNRLRSSLSNSPSSPLPPGFLGLMNGRTIRKEAMSDTYIVEEKPFARGKFATVRRCRHKETGVPYAAKIMRKRRRCVDVRHEILHEISILDIASTCDQIVSLHDVFETPSEIVLVLQLVAGGELQRLIDEDESLAEADVVRFMRQILEGLAFLHDRNIAHLDLKPQNLLLTSAYPHCDVKLCDFGISRFVAKGVEVREIVGTPDYVAPEVLNYEPISLATDMWSVGVLTYVLLTGHSPFAGENKQETFSNISQRKLDFPEELFHDISMQARDFICKLLVCSASGRLTVRESLNHPWLQQQNQPCTFLPSPSFTEESEKPKATHQTELLMSLTMISSTSTTTIRSSPMASPRLHCRYQSPTVLRGDNKENISITRIETRSTKFSEGLMLDEGLVC